jgi:hypothetical protein
VQITRANGFTNCAAGLVAYCTWTNFYTSGRYEIYAKIDNSNIVLDEPWFDPIPLPEPTADVKAGGSFPGIVLANGLTSALYGYDCYVYTNVFLEQAGNVIIPSASHCGSVANNSHKYVKGFHTTIGDMDEGGAYYQGPLDCLENGVDTATPKCITIDAEGGAYSAVRFNSYDCAIWENFYFYNTDKAADHDCCEFTGTVVALGLINCKFDTGYRGIDGTSYGLTLERCYVGSDFAYSYVNYGSWTGGQVIKSVFNGDGRSGCHYVKYAVWEGCLFFKSSYGARCDHPNTFHNCTWYGQTIACIYLGGASYGVVKGHSNIFIPNAASDYVVYAAGATGAVSALELINSCVWTVAGVAVTNHISINGITRQLSSVVEADPQFVDPDSSDFRLQLSSPCLHTGLATLGAP